MYIYYDGKARGANYHKSFLKANEGRIRLMVCGRRT